MPQNGFNRATVHVLQAVAQEARFACVRRLVEVDSKQRYAFLEGAMQTLAAHVRCANRSAEVCGRGCRACLIASSRHAAFNCLLHRLEC